MGDATARVTVGLYDLSGREVLATAGTGRITLDTQALPRGLYLLRATRADGEVSSVKIVLE